MKFAKKQLTCIGCKTLLNCSSFCIFYIFSVIYPPPSSACDEHFSIGTLTLNISV
jgi:hypothetical protein